MGSLNGNISFTYLEEILSKQAQLKERKKTLSSNTNRVSIEAPEYEHFCHQKRVELVDFELLISWVQVIFQILGRSVIL